MTAVGAGIILGGCIELTNVPPTVFPEPELALPTPVVGEPISSTATSSLYPWTDENRIMSGICFEAAMDASRKVYVLRNSDDHIHFYDLADNSQLCRQPVTRYPFDFNNGRVLAGLWSYGRGCTARHDVLTFNRDDTAKTITIQLQFVAEGTCDYELVRPFWIGLDNAQDYGVEIQVQG